MRKPSDVLIPLITMIVALAALSGSMVAPSPAAAAPQQGGQMEPMNLQVLPADMGRREVMGIMRGFTASLGVRCEYCHVGDDPNDLSTFDFASDEKHHKEVARVMLRMVTAINDTHLAELDEHGGGGHGERLNVTCSTCHHGQARPVTIGVLLVEAHSEGGLETLNSEYARLREQYYGSWTYDFSERMLLAVASSIAAAGNLDDALAVIDTNLEAYPGSVFSHGTKGQLLARAGRVEEARAAYQACVDADPTATFCKDSLDRLSQQ